MANQFHILREKKVKIHIDFDTRIVKLFYGFNWFLGHMFLYAQLCKYKMSSQILNMPYSCYLNRISWYNESLWSAIFQVVVHVIVTHVNIYVFPCQTWSTDVYVQMDSH